MSTKGWAARSVVAGALAVSAVQTAWALPPAGFVNESVIAGLDRPTDLAFLPDGRLLIVTKPGQLWTVDPAASPAVALPYMTLPGVHSTYSESGVTSVVLDPSFATTGYFYLYYAHAASFRFRLSRFTHAGDHANPASEVVIWSDDQDFSSCCHWGGGVDFGPDGKIYLATGDKTPAGRATTAPQTLTVAAGKLLRLNPNGSAPADNPFHDGTGTNLDSIWALGLRNPFRLKFDGPTGRMFVAEVGDFTAEDIHLGRRGANYGWTQCEGMCTNAAYDDPIFTYPTWPHASITGGLVYRGTLFLGRTGAYFFGDYVHKWIHYLTFDASGTVPVAETEFEPAAGDMVAFARGPEGALYYANHSGAVRRITPGSPKAAGTITFDENSFASAKACTAATTLRIAGVDTGAQSDRILIAAVATEQLDAACDLASTAVSATYAGRTLTKAATAKANRKQGNACSAIFYLLGPPTGSGDVVVTWPSSATSAESVQRFGAAYVISGAAQEPPEATAIRSSERASSPTVNAATFTPGAFVADIAIVGNSGAFTPQAEGQNELFELACDDSSAAGSTIENAAPGIVEAGWVHTNSNRSAQALAAFAPAAVADADRDGDPDTSDPCNNPGAHDMAGDATLELKRIDAANARSSLSITGEFAVAVPFSSLDPALTGARIVVKTSTGRVITDAAIPPGARWSGGARRRVFKDGGANGIVRFAIRDLGDRVRVRILGRRGTYAAAPGDEPLNAIVVVGDGQAGACGETVFAEEDCAFHGSDAVECRAN